MPVAVVTDRLHFVHLHKVRPASMGVDVTFPQSPNACRNGGHKENILSP